MQKFSRDKRNYLIISLCAILVVMAVGYAAFSQNLQIKGSSQITSNWNIQITNIEVIDSKGAKDQDGSPTYDKLSANFKTTLTSPGDYEVYKIDVTNNGTLDAVLEKINQEVNSSNDYIKVTITGLKENDKLFSNETRSFNVKVEFDNSIEINKLTEDISLNLNLSLDYKQADKTVPDRLITIKFDSGKDNDDEGTLIEPIQLNLRDKIDLSSIGEPKMRGHEFVGWWTRELAGGTKANDGDMVARIFQDDLDSIMESGEATLHAFWAINSYKVFYNIDGGTKVSTSSKLYNSQGFQTPIPAKTGYIFEGWYTEPNGAGERITENTKVKDILGDDDTVEGVTIYANYEKRMATITYDSNGGSNNGEEFAPEIYWVKDGIKLDDKIPTREGYKFIGWYTKQNTGKLINNGKLIYQVTGNITATEKTIYAHWEPIS